MAKRYEYGVLITGDDQASQVFRKVAQEAVAAGKSMEVALKEAAKAADQVSKAQSGLSGYIATQRKEQREQNFLFGQARDVMGAASIALGTFGVASTGASAQMQTLSAALNQGWIAFQGLDAIVAAIGLSGGPWGLAIAALGAAAAAVLVLSQDVETATISQKALNAELEKQYDLLVKLGRIPGPEYTDRLQQELESVERGIELAKKLGQDYTALTTRQLELQSQLIDRRRTEQTVIDQQLRVLFPNAMKQYDEELRVKDALIAYQQRYNELFKAGRLAEANQLRERFELLQRLEAGPVEIVPTVLAPKDNAFEALRVPREKFAAEWKESILQVRKTVRQVPIVAADEFVGLSENWNAAMLVMADAAGSFAGKVSGEFEKMFGQANSLLQMFVQSVLSAIARMLAAQMAAAAVAGLVSLATGGALSFGAIFKALGGIEIPKKHEGGVVPKAHEGGTISKAYSGLYVDAPPVREFPIIVRGGETVRTERQESMLQGRLSGALEKKLDQLIGLLAGTVNRPIVITGALDGQQFFIDQAPRYEKYLKLKRVDRKTT